MRTIKYIVAIAIYATSFVAVGQDAQAPKSSNPFSFLQSIFSPKPAALAKLLDEKRLAEADQYLATERQYFLIENKKEQQELLQRLANALNEMHEPYMETSITALSAVKGAPQESRWSEIKSSNRVAENLVVEYKKFQIFESTSFRTKKIEQLENTISAAYSSLDLAAPSAFAQFNHMSSVNFFSTYPKTLPSSFLSDNAVQLKPFVKTLQINQIVQLKSQYPEQIPESVI